jgi:epoxyqueuosine reductase QueG
MELELSAMLRELLAGDEKTGFDNGSGEAMFDGVSVAVAAADDAWFARFKEIIGPFYWTPQEALSVAAPQAIARSVICWSLPISSTARLANRREKQFPARAWAYVRTFGEHLNTRLRHGMEVRLRSLGLAAVAPAVLPENTVAERPAIGLSSCWSERHTAFVAGLGTFGLSGGLITRRGIAHRLGSVVTDAELVPTARAYGDDPFAWCLQIAGGKCGVCINRCPVESIGQNTAARDKLACKRHYAETIKTQRAEIFGWEGVYGCGLCQAGVPCEDRIPLVPPQSKTIP